MLKSETYTYNECIGAAAKLDLIVSMVESMEDTDEDILAENDYNKLQEAENILNAVANSMRNCATLYVTKED